MTPEQYCQQKLIKGTSIYYSLRFAPATARNNLTALHAFFREIDSIPTTCHDPELAKIKLQWWHNEIDNLYQGKPQHPVTKALQAAIEQHKHKQKLTKELWQSVIAGTVASINLHSFATFNELEYHCHQRYSPIYLLAGEICGYQQPQTLRFNRDIGTFLKMVSVVRNLRRDLHQGNLYLPLEWLDLFALTPEMLCNPDAQNNQTKIIKLLQYHSKQALKIYEQAMTQIAPEDRHDQRSMIILANLHKDILQLIHDENFQVFKHYTTLTPLRKLWRAWRVYIHSI